MHGCGFPVRLRRDGGHGLLAIRTEASDQVGIVVAIEDAGVGIGPGRLDQIFTAFYTTKSDGLRLGLPLSRSVIEDHGGKLWVEPNENHGMTFRFTLPENTKTPP